MPCSHTLKPQYDILSFFYSLFIFRKKKMMEMSVVARTHPHFHTPVDQVIYSAGARLLHFARCIAALQASTMTTTELVAVYFCFNKCRFPTFKFKFRTECRTENPLLLKRKIRNNILSIK